MVTRKTLSMRNQKGIAAIGTSLVLVVLGFILLATLQDQTVFFVRQSLKNRTQLDVENSIDVFAKELYYSYIMAKRVADSTPGPGGYGYTDPSQHLVSGAKRLYWPTDRTICFDRELTSWSQDPNPLAPANYDPICLDRNNGFTFNLNIDEVQAVAQVFKAPPPELSMEDYLVVALKNMADVLSLPMAEAQHAVYDPGATVFVPLTHSFSFDALNADFQERYEKMNCTSSAGFECITVKFCARLKQKCDPAKPEEWITQTYLFDQPPNSMLRN